MAVALLVASILLGVYYALLIPKQEGYLTFYLLDSQEKAFDYPELVVSGENSTFSVYFDVENHMGKAIECQVVLKVSRDMNPTFPLNVNDNKTYASKVEDGHSWRDTATVSLSEPGNYMVVFELWTWEKNEENIETLLFSKNSCLLNVRVL